MTKTRHYIEIGEDEITVDFHGEVSRTDGGGIYDYGDQVISFTNWQTTVDEIEWDTARYSEEQNDAIQRYFDKHEEQIARELIEKWEKARYQEI